MPLVLMGGILSIFVCNFVLQSVSGLCSWTATLTNWWVVLTILHISQWLFYVNSALNSGHFRVCFYWHGLVVISANIRATAVRAAPARTIECTTADATIYWPHDGYLHVICKRRRIRPVLRKKQ